MKLHTAPTALTVIFVLLYAVFIVWYGGSSKPLTAAEIDKYIERMTANFNPDNDPKMAEKVSRNNEAFRTLAEHDDGKEFIMLNLLKYRDKAYYPDHQHMNYGDDALEADRRYSEGVQRLLLKFGGIPVFFGDVQGRFLHPQGVDDWDKTALVRYRSRRDMLEMVSHPDMATFGFHKTASLEKTQVFPVKPVISFIFVRSAVAVLLLILGVAVHLVCRNFSFYRKGT